VQLAKDFITAAIAGSYLVAVGHHALNPRPLPAKRVRPGRP
jgi:hypothetical protein